MKKLNLITALLAVVFTFAGISAQAQDYTSSLVKEGEFEGWWGDRKAHFHLTNRYFEGNWDVFEGIIYVQDGNTWQKDRFRLSDNGSTVLMTRYLSGENSGRTQNLHGGKQQMRDQFGHFLKISGSFSHGYCFDNCTGGLRIR